MAFVENNVIPARLNIGLQEVVNHVLTWAGNYRTIYIKPNFTTPAPLCGVSTEEDLVRKLVSSLAAPQRSIFLCESDTKARTAQEAFQVHLGGEIPEGCVLANLTTWNDFFEIETRSGIWTLPAFLRNHDALLVNLTCLKDNDTYRTSGPVKNLYGLVREKKKERIHRFSIDYLFDLLWTIIDNLRINIVNLVDGRWHWRGDFVNGKAVDRGVMALSRNLMALEHWTTEQCVTFGHCRTVLDERPYCTGKIREGDITVFSLPERARHQFVDKNQGKEAGR